MTDVVGYAIMGFFIAIGTETSKVVHEWYIKPWLEKRREHISTGLKELGKIGNGGKI